MPAVEADPHRCWICGGASRPFRPSTIRQTVDSDSVRITDSRYGETAALSICQTCGFVFADPVPHSDVLGLYEGMEDDAYQDGSASRRLQMRGLLGQAVAARPAARTLLDIGAGTGLLVSEARARGLDAHGIEPSRWGVETARTANQVELLLGTTQDWLGRLGRYDIVTLIDVIEHTTDPLTMVREAASFLAPGGVLVIVTPDIGSVPARVMGRRWWHHRVAHVGYFNRSSMRRALKEANLVLEGETYATWRFPVSYLAERLVRYVPIFPVSTVLRRLARAPRLGAREIPVNLRDSRTFIASNGAA
jgi:2-polyprenyl-3-methyl-5-hydroxy-6-metoxy-1,4-benzoquinol methylase